MCARTIIRYLTAFPALVLAVTSVDVFASVLRDCGGGQYSGILGSTITFYYREGNGPDEFTTAEIAAIQAGADAWNKYTPNLGLTIVLEEGYSGDPVVERDNKNLLLRDNTIYPGQAGISVIRYDLGNLCDIVEADIRLAARAPGQTTNTDTTPKPGGPSNDSIAILAAHEFGHALGLSLGDAGGHETEALSLMSPRLPMGGPLGARKIFDALVQPHADDVDGVRSIYGISAISRDLAATSYTRVGDEDGKVLDTPLPAFVGDTRTFEYTIENRGSTPQYGVKTNLYLSGNTTISTSDVPLHTDTWSIDSGQTETVSVTVTIPSVDPGHYYYGWIIDPDNAKSEYDDPPSLPLAERNNFAGLPERFQVLAFVEPNPVSFLDIILEGCYGYNTATWPASTGASHYVLRGNFSGIQYSGPSRTIKFNIPTSQGMTVEACNAAGCSNQTNGDQIAQYFPYCQ